MSGSPSYLCTGCAYRHRRDRTCEQAAREWLDTLTAEALEGDADALSVVPVALDNWLKAPRDR